MTFEIFCRLSKSKEKTKIKMSQNISYQEIKNITDSINAAIENQQNVVHRIQALRQSMQEDRSQFLDQLQTEISNSREELRRETKAIYQKMVDEVVFSASEILRSATIQAIRERSLDQSAAESSTSQDQPNEQNEKQENK